MHVLLQPTEIALRQSSSVAHLYAPGPRLKRVNQQSRSPSLNWLDFYSSTSLMRSRAIDDATDHARSDAKKYRTRSRKKVSGRCYKTRSVGLVEAETFFCLALNLFFSTPKTPFYSAWVVIESNHKKSKGSHCVMAKKISIAFIVPSFRV